MLAEIANLVGIACVAETAAWNETATATGVAFVTRDEHDKCWPVRQQQHHCHQKEH